MTPTDPAEIQRQLDSAPVKIYCNGFTNALGMGDVILILHNNNRVAATVNVSYTVAKTLAEKLAALITQLEDETGQTIMTTDEVRQKMEKNEL
jgi:ACT domain-containing protein